MKMRGPRKAVFSLSDEWNSRFLVLRSDSLEWHLFEYGYLLGTPPKHRAPLSKQCSVLPQGPEGNDFITEGYLFTVEVPEVKVDGKVKFEAGTYVFACEAKDDRDEWVTEIQGVLDRSSRAASESIDIGLPTNFQHVAQIKVGTDVVDLRLPQDWQDMMDSNGITLDDLKKNPETLLKVLDFTSKDMRPTLPKHQYTTTQLETAYKENLKTDDPRPHYADLQSVARGGFGQVYLGRRVSDDRMVAIKIIPLSARIKRVRLFNEIALMFLCQHENVTSLLETYEFEEQVWVVMEYMNRGALTDLITPGPNGRHKMTEPEIAFVCRNVLEALRYMHQRYRVHRDIKSDNVLLAVTPTGQALVKLADFGFATQLTDIESARTSKIGTPAWMAPEVVLKQHYDQAADIWSFGMVCLEMADSEPPFLNLPRVKCLQAIVEQPSPTMRNPEKWSPEFNDFVAKALTKDPTNRPNSDTLLFHAFIQKACEPGEFGRILERRGSLRE